ncbi:MAG: alpha/beta hydrolase fold domain-containing protein [Deltaproteobacteria bacterium]|jgi:acetyl esterase/lipase
MSDHAPGFLFGVDQEPSPGRPAFDPELRAGLAIVGGMFPPTITPDLIDFMRISYAGPPLDALITGRPIRCEERTFFGYEGHELEASIFRHTEALGARPGILFVHSGGLMFGDRFSGLDRMLDFVEQLGVVLVSIEYRLAPEHRDPYPREDVYAALEWVASDAEALGIHLDRLLIAGASAGGGLAAGAAIAARDRGGPRLCGQLLDYPMLDDRGVTKSTNQFDGIGVWDRVSNETGWSALLGERRGGPDVSPYAAPARATELHDLPPAFLDVGSAEIFRDEAVAYADALWNAGGHAELHVWPGGFHAFDIFAPHTALSRGMIATRNAWMSRVLAD